MNVLSRAGEGEKKREENTKRAGDRGETEANNIIKWTCGKSKEIIENIVDII